MLNTSLPVGRLKFGGHARQTALMWPAPNKTPGAECPRSFPGGHCCPRGRTSRCWSYVCLLWRLQGARTPASLCLDPFGLHPTRLCALLTLLHVLPGCKSKLRPSIGWLLSPPREPLGLRMVLKASPMHTGIFFFHVTFYFVLQHNQLLWSIL